MLTRILYIAVSSQLWILSAESVYRLHRCITSLVTVSTFVISQSVSLSVLWR